MSNRRGVLAALMIAVMSSAAYAEDIDLGGEQKVVARDVAEGDAFTPGIARSTGRGRAIAVGAMTWNGAAPDGKTKTTLDMTGEVGIFGPFRLVLQVANVFDTARPGIGAAVQWLDEQKHGVSSSAYLSYKAEGFTEPEGEIEAVLSFGKHLGPLRGTLNLAYGQDADAKERDGEAAAALHIEPIRGLFTGVVGRYRDALGSGGDKGIIRDVIAGASATYTLGKIGVTVTGGISGVKEDTAPSMKTGPVGVFSLGAVF
jgi:hypothetical protein